MDTGFLAASTNATRATAAGHSPARHITKIPWSLSASARVIWPVIQYVFGCVISAINSNGLTALQH
ncbi:hypothetical protein CU103_22555 [Phyllobacterium sophorae]|uniref:Uncharacterized protein n=1 Tax=Phyllobacterium sophorae TaxID=1520277 RepID=A0A2P7B554_9HYPH|nr:hypothetical protein CU103_22555 [Phyllobacterium sophorae]